MILFTWFIWFIFYSVLGWIYETTFCSIKERRPVNRGFLNGPYCPIYGTGAILDLLLLGWIENPFALFLLGMIVTGTVEYLTGWTLEKLFHAKWWDYSNWKFHIHGRVCLLGLIVFGFMSVIMIKLVHPFVITQTNQLSDISVIVIALCTGILLLIDSTYTLVRFHGFHKKLQTLHVSLKTSLAASKEQLNDIEMYQLISTILADFKKKLNKQESRMMLVFPKFRSTLYNDALIKLKEFISSKRTPNE